jgi:formylglycine-generating enzyme required for sulfatase activity
MDGDPEALTQFIHGARARGLGVTDLADALRSAEDENEQFALLLALGEFSCDEVPGPQLGRLTDELLGYYQAHPRSGVHGACGWLLRRWGLRAEVDRLDAIPIPFDRTGRRDWFIEQIGDNCLTFAVFPPGEFMMGSPPNEPKRRSDDIPHRVRITQTFALSVHQVSVAQWECFRRHRGKEVPDHDAEVSPTPDHPVNCVSWLLAVRYCRWLTAQAPGRGEEDQCYEEVEVDTFRPERGGFRLPAEAEWEYACRAGTATAYSFGNDSRLLDRYGALQGLDREGTNPVGALRPNLRGLFDLHGNVYEWCQEWYDEYPSGPTTDTGGPPRPRQEEPCRVLRGGGWSEGHRVCRSAFRHANPPANRVADLGLRVACTLGKRGS